MVALVGAPEVAAQPIVLESSQPAYGARVDALSHVDLRFSSPVELPADGVRLLDAAGAATPTGVPELLPDGTIRVPVRDVGAGLRVLSWSGTAATGDDPVSGSIAFDVGPVASGALDRSAIAGASSGSRLAIALIVVSLLVAAAAAGVLALRAGRRRSHRGESRVPLPALLRAAAAAALLGALLGIGMVIRGTTALTGDAAFAALISSQLGLWCLAAGVVAIVIALSATRLSQRAILSTAVVLASAAVVIGVVTAPEIPLPAGDVDVRVQVDGGAQVSIAIRPGAVGRNSAAIDVRGEAKATMAATALEIRPLDGAIGAMRIPLEVTENGLVASTVLLPYPGRWRGQITGLTDAPDTPPIFDFTVQPNPGAVDGSGT